MDAKELFAEQSLDRLLGPDDSPPFQVINRDGASQLLLICDHASAEVPHSLGRMGVHDEGFEQHIGYDIGSASVARLMSEQLDAQLILAGYSRLVIDLNRPPGHPESILAESDGTPIPGNASLGESDRRQRIRDLFEPYHDAVNRALARLWERGTAPILFSVHSFSPGYGDKPRPWDVGVLWNRDPRIAVPLMEKLEARGLNVGDNEPYSGHDLAYTIDMHGAAAGIANCVIEINQEQVGDETGIARWGELLAEVLGEILTLDGLHRVERF